MIDLQSLSSEASYTTFFGILNRAHKKLSCHWIMGDNQERVSVVGKNKEVRDSSGKNGLHWGPHREMLRPCDKNVYLHRIEMSADGVPYHN
ncbi:hypothetical protein NC653_000049 [Populus alba x Populus x berolinensis]|uniref:Uncharacterized protein n=1 Tax=Populus alba x Populus x berolinensis TaxID=444605 RepID=A0AAD6RIE4_9ROSI|nr:hypothetical protein NC653_000049 [Populus alba x Populus x berolinensis]